jgi:hypothetical protein
MQKDDEKQGEKYLDPAVQPGMQLDPGVLLKAAVRP